MRWVVLTGYMGAGKSSVGRALAARLGCAFVDSDARIEADAGIDIPKIFATKGELWFRRTEERTIRTIVGEEPPGVLSVGGGAVESQKTRDFLRRHATVIWLEADPELLWARVSGSTRPLATDQDRFARRYDRRRPAYADAATVTIDAELPLEDVVDAVAAVVGDAG